MERQCVYSHEGYVPSGKVTTKKVLKVSRSNWTHECYYVDFEGLKQTLSVEFRTNENGQPKGWADSISSKRIRKWRIVSVNDTEFYR